MQTIEFNSYLSSVNDLFSCNRCLVIGIGSGSYINTLESLGFQDVILVDADEYQLQKMQKMHSVPSSYVVKNVLIYKDEANIPFNIATNPTVSCFKTIDTYKQLMPNVSLLETKELQGYALATFIQSFEDKEINWLIIDTFTALEILSKSKDTLDALEVVVCEILSDTTEALYVFMLENDFALVKTFEENNPKMGVVVYVKDYSAKNAKSEMQKSALEKQLQAEQEIVNSLKESTVKEIQSLKVQKTELEQNVTSCQDEQKVFQNREKELVVKLETQKSQFEKQLKETQGELERLKVTSTDEKKKLEIQSDELEKKLELSNAKKTEFETKLDSQKNELDKTSQIEMMAAVDRHFKSYEGQLNTVKKSVLDQLIKSTANVAKQLESYMALQNYLVHGTKPLNYHGWPISPDIALFLIEQIEQNDYDLIIEFGSGTSTALFANVIKHKKKKSKNSNLKKVVTFEHNEEYYEKTKALLEQHGVAKYSDLVLAPLVEYKYEESEFMYYDCVAKLEELATLGSIGKILVLVDGPPGITCPLARFPVLLHLLNAFKNIQIHLALDDYNRDEEKRTAQKWEEILKIQSIKFYSENIASEKGLYFCQINEGR